MRAIKEKVTRETSHQLNKGREKYGQSQRLTPYFFYMLVRFYVA